MICRHEPVGSGIIAHISVDTAGLQIGSRAEYHCLTVIQGTGKGFKTCDTVLLSQDFTDLRLPDRQILRIFQYFPHTLAVSLFIRLGPERMNRRSL